jgi:AraC family transcriptional regulator
MTTTTEAPGRRSGALTLQRKAVDQISVTATNGPPPAIAEIDRHGTVITAPWEHPPVHDDIPGLSVHLIGTYYGVRGKSSWRSGRMRVDGYGKPGAIAIAPADYWGRWDIEAPAPVSYVLLSDKRLQEFADQTLARRKQVELMPRIGEADKIGAYIMRVLGRLAMRPERADAVLIEQTLDLLCSHLMRVHASDNPAMAQAFRRGLLPWQVRRVTAYMEERLEHDISLTELAGVLNLSRFHFCTAFRRATGQTPHDWLVARRIERARRLLVSRELSVTDIALAVGYSTPSAFAASFRKVTGMTPSDFRRTL